MVLDRRKTQEIVQALIRARNRTDGGNILENVTQTSAAPGDGSYYEPVFGRMGYPSASQPGVTTGDKAANQSRTLAPTPRLHPFRDPAGLFYSADATDMAKARAIPAQDQLAFKDALNTSSRQANPRTTYGRPLAINAEAVPQEGYWDSFWERLLPLIAPRQTTSRHFLP